MKDESISITLTGVSASEREMFTAGLIGWVRSRQYANLIEKIGRLGQ